MPDAPHSYFLPALAALLGTTCAVAAQAAIAAIVACIAGPGLAGAFGHEADTGHVSGRFGVCGALAALLGTAAIRLARAAVAALVRAA